ncbi:Aldose 1-epimerase [Citrus sinensis]|uniref:Aldose 1-epimerase n=1 Tax=Citrus sinensis TaxID=2711 RepID=A0ACB8LQS5_CITSI|nr:Aldose 1-epimerase [Citrus sinensis]
MEKLSLVFCYFIVLVLFLTNNKCQATESCEAVGVYKLKRGDLSLKFTNYGATMLSAVIPDKYGKLADIVLGFDSVKDYKTDNTYFGAIVGRVANRISRAQFTLNGTRYQLINNDGDNMLHGFPGDLAVSVTYMFVGENNLVVKMKAKPLEKATPVNLALHTYWNLGGHSSGDIFSHKLQLFGSHVTPVDDRLIPTGKITPVTGTPYDFLQPREIGSKFKELPDGYDINYVLDNPNPEHLKKVAVVSESVSGRKMELWTNKPGVQFYTSNMLGKVMGKDGFVYSNYAGFCLETQGFPDSVNNPNFPSQVVNPGETYNHVMVYRFTAD